MLVNLAAIPLDIHALDRLEKAVQTSPEPRVRALLVETLADRAQWTGADEYVKRLRFHLEKLPEVYQNYGRAFLDAYDGEFVEAAEHFLAYLRTLLDEQSKAPDATFAWRLYLRYVPITLSADRHLSEFLNGIAEAFSQRWPDAPISLYEHSQAAITRKSKGEARRWLNRALRGDNTFWIVHYDLGFLFAEEEDWDRAAKMFTKLLDSAIIRNDPLLCYQTATYMIRANRKAEATRAAAYYVECLENASRVSSVPSSEAVFLVDSRCALAVGEDQLVQRIFAEMVLKQCEKRWPQSALLSYLAGKIARASDDTKHALQCFADTLACDKTFWLAAVNAANVCASEDNWHAAASWYRLVLSMQEASRYPYIWFWAAFAYGKTKSHTEEISAYRECLKRREKCLYAKNNLGYALFKAGELHEAERVLREALALPTERDTALQNLVRTLKGLNRIEESMEVLKEDKTSAGKIRKSSLKEIERLEQFLASRGEGASIPGESDESSQDSATGKTNRTGVDIGQGRAPVRKEKVLESLIEEKILRGDVVFDRRLRMYDGYERLYGRQFPIPGIGVIDLLGVDTDSGDLVVIELKRDEATMKVIHQIGKYVKWIEKNLAKPGQSVIAVICAYRADKKLRRAAKYAGVEVYEYDITFVKVCGTTD